MKKTTFIVCLILFLLAFNSNAYAVLTNNGILDSITTRFHTAIIGWGTDIYDAANRLFWILVAISMVWTFGFMAMRKADIGEFFAEFLKFTLFVGFFKWLLDNGTTYAGDIILSLRTIGANAGGVPNTLKPSGIVDVGFKVCFKVIDNSSLWSPIDSAVAITLGIVICVVLALIAVNMVVLLCSSWFLLYGGIFFLGFGGSKWTHDIAINYYKTVLKIAVQLFAMILLVGTSQTLLDEYCAKLSSSLPYKEMVVMLVVSIVLLMLVNKIPELLASVVTGGMGSVPGGQQFGAGSAMAAAAMAGSLIATGGASAAGGVSAIKSAITAAGSGGGGGMAQAAANMGQAFSDFASDNGGGDAGFFGGGSNEATPTDSTSSESSEQGESTVSEQENNDDSDQTNSIESGSNEKDSIGSKPSEQKEQPSNSSSSSAPAFAANVMRNLASGVKDVMKEKVDDRVSQTTGGKIANAINQRVSDGRAWSNKPSAPSEDEISSFVNKES